jgi:hypothetical protein
VPPVVISSGVVVSSLTVVSSPAFGVSQEARGRRSKINTMKIEKIRLKAFIKIPPFLQSKVLHRAARGTFALLSYHIFAALSIAAHGFCIFAQ